MAVPNNSNFSLQDVVDEVNPLTESLVDCFSSASTLGFNISYAGNQDRLSNFRGYLHSSGGYGYGAPKR